MARVIQSTVGSTHTVEAGPSRRTKAFFGSFVRITSRQGSENIDENVVRLRTAHLGQDKNLVIFEVWSANTYLRTMLMLVANNGTVVHGPTTCPSDAIGSRGQFVRLNSSDNTIAFGYSGNAGTSTSPAKLVRYDIVLNITDDEYFLNVSSACGAGSSRSLQRRLLPRKVPCRPVHP